MWFLINEPNSHMFELVKQAGMFIYHLWISLRWLTTEKQPRGTWILLRLTFFFHEILLLTMNLKDSAAGMIQWPEGGHGVQVSLSQITHHHCRAWPNYNRCSPDYLCCPVVFGFILSSFIFLTDFASDATKMKEEDASIKRAMLSPRLFTQQTPETKDRWCQHYWK